MGERPRARSETLALTYINVAGEQRDTELFGLGPIWATQVASNPKNEKTNEHTGAGRTMYRFLEGTADQYMTRAVTTVTRQTTIRELEALIEKHDFNSFPVVEEEKMLGIVTKFDFLRAFAFTTGQMVPEYDKLMRRQIAEMMTEAVVHVEPAAPLTRVLQLMVSLKSRSFPVIGPDRQLVGMISREDVIRALKDATQDD
jgi:CBS domain-containing protein